MSRIYVSDLDGTLLQDNATLSDFSKYGINKLVEAGVNFTVASARNRASQQQILTGVNLQLPVVEINGAFISDLNTAEHFSVKHIDPDIIPAMFKVIDEHGCMPFVTAFDGKNDHLYYEGINNDGMVWFLGDKTEGHSKHAKQIETLEHILEEQIVCLTVMGPEEIMANLYESIEQQFGSRLDNFFFPNPYCPEWHWLTIHSKDARKDYAIRDLVKLKGFQMSDLTVFGDQINDTVMMKLNEDGATSVAVGNAIDEVKQLASLTIPANTDDSVVKYIAEQESVEL